MLSLMPLIGLAVLMHNCRQLPVDDVATEIASKTYWSTALLVLCGGCGLVHQMSRVSPSF